jgi:radical SAM superfamily enzyme YgiQ (UPF0313 family)
MYDIVFVHVPYMFNTNPPLAGPLLKACLKQHNINTKVLDLNIDFINSNIATDSIVSWLQKPDIKPNKNEYENYKNWITKQAENILKFNSKYVGISVFTKDSQLATEDLAYQLKLLNPKIKIIIGGLGANVNLSQWNMPWYNLIYESGLADVVIIGEAEHELVNTILEDKTGIIKAKQLLSDELDSIPKPIFDDYDLSNYTSEFDNEIFAIPITASKGCVRDCTFCDVGKHWSKFTSRKGENVANEIIYYYKNYNFKFFRFTDSLINGNVKEFKIMNSLLTETIPSSIKYRGQFICRPKNQMPAEDFKLMASAGAYKVQIGIESGSENVRNHMRKKFSNDDIEYSTYELFKNSIKQSWFIFVGYPTETHQDFIDTLNLVKKYKDLAQDQMLQIIPTGVFQMLDGTPISELDMMNDLGIELNNIQGYTTYAWTSKLYPDNTFKERANRFKILVELCKEHNFISEYENMVDGHLKMITNQEAFFRE